MALGLPQSQTEQSQALLALFAVSITKRVNSGLRELTQPPSSNSSSESVSSTDSQTEDIVYHIAHILRACMRNDKGLPSPQFSRRSCTFSDDETDIKKIMAAADELLVLTDFEERSATPAGKPPQKSSEEEAEDDEEFKIVLDFLASEREDEASVKPESPPKRSAKEEEEERLYLETAAEFFPGEDEASVKPESRPKTSAEQKEENGRILEAALEFLASEGENYSSIERENRPQKSAEEEDGDEEPKAGLDFLASENEDDASVKPDSPPKRSAKEEEEERLYLETAAEFFPGENEASVKPESRPQRSAEKLDRKAVHYSLGTISPVQDYDISGKKSEVRLFPSLVVEASDSFGEPLKSEEGLGSECTSPSSSLVYETSNSHDEQLPQQRRKVLKKAKKAKKGKKKADYSSTETSDGGTQQRYDERYLDEEEHFYSEEELLIKQHRTCLTVFLVKLLDHIATPSQTIYHSDFEGMVERLRMKTDTIGFATLLRTREKHPHPSLQRPRRAVWICGGASECHQIQMCNV
ncbi:hypothetical protein KUCAC02_016985 [Chaenocephalus aceratus]|nr:hypothetical protein KUCAC02_016985 [Chaenocephalus aceratus]